MNNHLLDRRAFAVSAISAPFAGIASSSRANDILIDKEKEAYDKGYSDAMQWLVDRAKALKANGVPADPHIQWQIEWRKAQRDFENAPCLLGGGDGDNPIENEAFERSWIYAERIAETVPQTAGGCAMQLSHFLENYGPDCFGSVADHFDRKLIESAILGLKGMSA